MFRPRSMQKVEILLLRRDLAPLLKALAAARIIHLCRIEAGGPGDTEPPAGEDDLLARYCEFLALTSGLQADLGLETATGQPLDAADFPAWEEWAARVRDELDGLRARQGELRRCRLRLVAAALLLRRLAGVPGAYHELAQPRFTCLQLGLLPGSALPERAALPESCQIYSLGRIGNWNLVAVLALRRGETSLERLLDDLQFSPIPLFQRVRGDLAEVAGRLRRLRRRLRERLASLQDRLGDLLRTSAPLLRDRRSSVAVELHLLEERREFGFTRRTVAIGGWVTERRQRELQGLLEESCGGRFQLRETAASDGETPVLMTNPRLLRPFQKVLEVLGTPSYREIEPTPLLACGFLLLFGMMFGDVGHGLVLVLAGLALRRWSRWRDLGLVMAEVGCCAALFGVLFGSYFGWEGLAEPLWFSPLHDIPRLMAVAVALGVALITVGMLLRIVNGLRQEPPARVLTDRFGAAGLGFYLAILTGGFLAVRSILPPAALALAGLPLAAVFFHPFTEPQERGVPRYQLCAEGLIEILETVLGLLANTFSFLRVAAFGLAHVGLSLAVFALADQVLSLPLGGVLAGLVHLVGNLLILILEGLVVSIQAVRLQFYEFFGKFFRGGGTRFTPLALNPVTERRL